MNEIAISRHSGEQALAMLEEITDLYVVIHAEDDYHADPLFSRSSFITRTTDQAGRPGFQLITARVENALVGFSFGFPFGPGRWWAHGTKPDQEILDASKFAVIELDVRADFRGQGLGKRLLNMLLADRGEEFATLTAIPVSPAHGMYMRWGWHIAGEVQGEGPVMSALVFRLQGGRD